MFEPQSREYLGAPDAFERQVLQQWDECDLLHRIAEGRAGCEPYVFYEGPPTANGRPGIHHVLARSLKDAVCRYHTMRGKRIERKAGWDTHGLPVELEVEKQLGISGRPAIEEYGIGPFNAKCRDSVFTYKGEWEEVSKRIGFLLDYAHPYVTFHKDYVESVWYLLSRFDAQGMLYQGYKVLPWCGRCGTGLSSHEVGQGYQDIDDPSVWVGFPLVDGPLREVPAKLRGAGLVAWTTTPWTLPSNMGLAVNPGFTYALVEVGDAKWILLESKADEVFGEGAWTKLAEVPAAELVELSYEPLHDRAGFEDLTAAIVQNSGEMVMRCSHVVLADDYVSDEDGTGVVHLAPYGADDFRLAQQYGLQPMLGVGADARLVAETLGVPAGTFFRDANKELTRALKERGRMLKVAQYRHSYPHCWRCDTPLIYFPSPAWFLRTTAFKDAMIEGNAGIRWAPPEIGSGRFGEWLANNIDWALSRDRYWGTPLPVWECDASHREYHDDPPHREVVASFAKLGELSGGLPDDFDPHRPMVDAIAFPCTHTARVKEVVGPCRGTMRRVPQVIDCWFDSGAMPYAQHHWPFENRARVAEQFPADFICEGLDQTRGWFYSLHAIATFLTKVDAENSRALGLRVDVPSAYRSCLVNGLLLDKSGQKMSKRLGNIVVPAEAIAEHGADAVRWSLLAGGAAHLSRRYDDGAVAETRRRVLGTLAASYDFLALYARTEGWNPAAARPARAARPALDRWVLARAADAAAECVEAWEGLQPSNALRVVEGFVVDELSNWYIRRSRRRFWSDEDAADQASAFATLHEALDAAVRMAAPAAPFLAEALWKQLHGADAETVHLQRFPDPADPEEGVLRGAQDAALSAAMEPILHAASLGRAVRERVGIRVRQPLAKLVVHIAGEAKLPASPRAYEAALREELNVKEVQWVDGTPDFLDVQAKPDFPRLGKRAGKDMKALSAAIAALDRATVFALQGGATAEVEANGTVYVLEGEDVLLQTRSAEGMEAETDGFVTIGLVTELTPELECEGVARELLNRIQTQRKESGLEVGDRVTVRVSGDAALRTVVETHGAWLADEVLAPAGLTWSESAGDAAPWRAWELPGGAVARIALEKSAAVG